MNVEPPRPSLTLRVGVASHREPQPAGYARLARRISVWTTNLLATAIVLAAGLAMGWQVLAWWHERPAAASAAAAPQKALPQFAEKLEFLTSQGPLRIERLRGDRAAAQAAMQAFCREGQVSRSKTGAGPGEVEFVANLARQSPLESAGQLDLDQPPGQAGMVGAVDRSSRRIVAWSLAAARGEREWSLFHFRPAAGQLKGNP